MANIARDKANCYICHETFTKSCILSYKRSGSVLSVLLYSCNMDKSIVYLIYSPKAQGPHLKPEDYRPEG